MLRKPNQVLFAFLLFLSSCAVTLPGGSSSGSGSTGSVPIYQGMTVGALSNSSNLQSPKNQNDINQENPFDLPNNEKLESKIESDLADLMQEETMDYYARPSETVRITINILNPQSYVILSFNLNGRRYQSFEFREGSTSTRLLMDVTLQNLPGVQSLTIDEIKYIVDSEGDNQIRDVVMFGDQTVEVGVGYSQLPIVNVVSQTVLPTTVNYSIEVSDVLNILSTQETAIYFYFFDGETLQKEELMVGSNELEFNKLTSKSLYQYAVVSALNPMDGEGPVLTYYDVEAFFTSNFIQLSVISTKESISYEVNVVNGLESGEVNRVELEKNSEIINSQENSIGSFNELLSNNDYAISVYYDYSHEGETVVFTEVYSLSTKTLAKSTPTFTFTDVVAGKEDVAFEYEVTDLDQVGSLSKIELLKGEEVVETLTEFEDTSFTNLLSNNDYQLKATYIYDLNDGVGEQSIVVSSQTKTLPKEAPEFSFSNLSPTKESITFDYVVTDLDQVGRLIKIELVKGDTIMETFNSFENLSIEGLLSNNQYLLKAYYEVDLNDGIGLQTLVFNQEFITLAKSTPTFTFTDVVAGKEDVTFEYEVTDLDEVGSLSKIELLKGEEVVETLTEFEDTSFTNLLSNNDYQLKATYTYDLNDGVGEQSIVVSSQTKTLPKEAPNLVMLIKDVQVNLIKVEVNLNDVDLTLHNFEIKIFDSNNEVISSFINQKEITINNLLSYTNYLIKLIYNYSLNEQIQLTLFENEIIKTVKTLAIPISINSTEYLTNNTIPTGGEVLIKLGILNPSNVILKYVIVNGEYYLINKTLSNSTNAVFKYIDNTDGGMFDLIVEGFVYEFESVEIELLNNQSLSILIKVLGTIDILDLSVSSNNSQINIISSDTNSIIRIWLKNPSLYEVFSIELQQEFTTTITNDDFSMSPDKQIITLPWTGNTNYYPGAYNMAFLVLRSITFGFDDTSTNTINFEINAKVIRPLAIVPNQTPLPISTYEDLISMTSGNSYYLANDIDLSSYNHTSPIDFNGFFDGRGHTIKNLNMVFISNTTSNNNKSMGLFGNIQGYFENIIFENSSVYLDLKQPLYFGLFAGYLSKGNAYNVKITGTHNISLISNTQVTYGNILGALSDNGSLFSSTVNGSINTFVKSGGLIEDQISRIGGVIGSSGGRSVEGNLFEAIFNVNSEFERASSRYASGYQFGGISGSENGAEHKFNVVSGYITLTDTMGLRIHSAYVGGIVGRVGNKHSNNLFLANLDINTNGYLYFGGFYGGWGSITFVNNFIFGGKVKIENASNQGFGYVAGGEPYNKFFNNNYVLKDSFIKFKPFGSTDDFVNINNDSVISKILNFGELPTNFDSIQLSIISFSETDFVYELRDKSRLIMIQELIEEINIYTTTLDSQHLVSILTKYESLTSNEKNLVINRNSLD